MGNIQNFYHNTSFSADKDGKIGIGNIESPVDLYVGSVLTGTYGDGTFATDAIVTNDTKSITIGANKRAAWGMDATTPTSTTFQSKLNIWTGNGDHITFGGSSTGIVTAWEEFNLWINNDSTNPGTLHLYHLSSKSEFARFTGGSGDNWLGINGDVGIGKTAPTQKLDIDAGAQAGGLGLKSSNSSYTAAFIGNTGSGNAGVYMDASNGDFVGSDYAFMGQNNSLDVEINTAPSGGGISFVPRGSQRMYINNAGLVGIGTGSPDVMFNVTDGGTQVAISNTYLAHLQSASNCGLAITAGASSNNYIAFGDSDNYDEGIINYNNSTRSFAFRTADGTLDDLVINSAGDVGIGNNSPNHRLDVTGDIYSSGQMLTKGSDFASFTVLGDLDTGLGNFNAAGRVSLVSDGKPEITVDQATIAFDNYTATAVATTGSLIPNQSNQAPTEDTLANICVDPDGNVVRGSQEGTWTFTKAQLDALATTTSGGTQLIQAPGANKAVVVEESNWMIKYSGTGSMSNNGFEIRQSTVVLADAGISRIPSGKINEIMNSAQGTPTNPSYGFYARDLPQYNNDARTYKTNAQTVLMRINTNATPANLVSISIKLKYRLFDATTF
jgi:hypothetical protein